jgi:hypothetical protein
MTSSQSPEHPLIPTHTDESVKVDLKVESSLLSDDLPPPSYQVTSEAPPPPAHPGSEQHSCCRRRCRRFGHLFIAGLFLWLTARYIVRHCELRRFGSPHPDDFPWVCLLQYRLLTSPDRTPLPFFRAILPGSFSGLIAGTTTPVTSTPVLMLLIGSKLSPLMDFILPDSRCGRGQNCPCPAPRMISFCFPLDSITGAFYIL